MTTGNCIVIYSRVNKHPRVDKIPVKGFSPEMSSFVPFNSTVENPHKSNRLILREFFQTSIIHFVACLPDY